MLPGKKYTLDDALPILRKHYWTLLVPCAVLGALSAMRASTQRDVYEAQTVIMVVPPSMPASIVQPAVTARIQDRLATLRTTILSPSRLERVILELDLYPDERRNNWPVEDIVGLMSRNIGTDTQGNSAFRVWYSGNDPEKVRQVTDRLAGLFVDESLAERQEQAEGATEFLDSELVTARTDLQRQEARLAAWKARYAGELPSQLEANLQQIQTTQMALRDLRDSINSDMALRLEYEKQLSADDPLGPVDGAAGMLGPVGIASPTAQQLTTAQTDLDTQIQRGRKPGHPDYDLAARRVRDLTARLERELSGGPAKPTGPAVSTSELTRRARVEQLKREIARLDAQMNRAREDERRLQASNAEAQRRVEAAPRRETEQTELTRDYEAVRGQYDRLNANRQTSQTAANLERRQGGELFKVLDRARLPERPVSPNRPRDIMLGLILGLALGAGVVVMLEYMDKSLKTDRDVSVLLDLPVLAVVPAMKSEEDMRRNLLRKTFATVGLGSLVVACFTFAAWVAVR